MAYRLYCFVWLLLSFFGNATANKNPFLVSTTEVRSSFVRKNVSNNRSNPSRTAAGEAANHHSSSQQQDDDQQPPLHLQNNPLLQIPCAVQLITSDAGSRKTVLQTFVDTGAQVSVLSVEAAEQAGLLQMMDRRYAGQAMGVGRCRVLGRLPAGCLVLYLNGEPISRSPAITILEHTHDGVDLLLGLDFLRDHGAIMNLRSGEMTLLEEDPNKREVSIPFIRPRNNDDFAKINRIKNNNKSKMFDSRFCLAADDEDNTKGVDMSGV